MTCLRVREKTGGAPAPHTPAPEISDGIEVPIGICPGKHHRWGRICALDEGHETLMEAPHWGRTSDVRPLAWVGSAPDDW
ncbi:hypothetical protein [Streptomyces sp. Y7]|uniref:hypothetical protein n=1 Tax=Streptomyces sp. Y7 TaxID=3342392 RepID=UPI00371D230A